MPFKSTTNRFFTHDPVGEPIEVDPVLDNAEWLKAKKANGTEQNILRLKSDDTLELDAVIDTEIKANLKQTSIFGLPLHSLRQADGAAMGVAETAGDHFVNLAANVWLLKGEVAENETEVSVSNLEFVLPSKYVAGGAITVKIEHRLAIVVNAPTNNGSTLDLEVFKSDKRGAVGSDIQATAAQTYAAIGTWKTSSFTVTPTGLVAGDKLQIKLTTSVIENAGASHQMESQIGSIQIEVEENP